MYSVTQVLKKMIKAINFVLNIPIKYPLTRYNLSTNGYFYTHSAYKPLICNNLTEEQQKTVDYIVNESMKAMK